MKMLLSALVGLSLLVTGCGGGDDSGGGGGPVAATTQEQVSPTVASGDAVLTEPGAEEVRFSSGDFEVVGELRLPGGLGPYPAVVIVHGDGPQTRTSTPGTSIIQDRFGEAGFAVFVWDKPGSGESTGEFTEGETLRQRAQILADGIEALAGHDAIDGTEIGVWGLSQAGWVMPLALELGTDIAFMISVSGGGEDSIEQLAYQVSQQLVCERGITSDEADLVGRWGPQVAKSPTYDDYVRAMEILLAIDGTDRFIGDEIAAEGDWQPWPTDIDAYFDPMTVIAQTTIPVLAVFGEMDRFVDPVQGAAAYEQALQTAGNENYHVEVIAGTGHTMAAQETPCGSTGATSDRYLELLEDWISQLAS